MYQYFFDICIAMEALLKYSALYSDVCSIFEKEKSIEIKYLRKF